MPVGKMDQEKSNVKRLKPDTTTSVDDMAWEIEPRLKLNMCSTNPNPVYLTPLYLETATSHKDILITYKYDHWARLEINGECRRHLVQQQQKKSKSMNFSHLPLKQWQWPTSTVTRERAHHSPDSKSLM